MISLSRFARVVLPAALLLGGAVRAQDPKTPAAPAGPDVPRSLDVLLGALVAPGKAPEVDLLYSGDVIGYIEDCGCKMNPAGGLARRAWLVNQLKSNYPSTPLVLLDSGNFSDNPTPAGDVRTAALLSGMVKLGYRAVNIGDRDLALGYDDFVKKTQGLPLEFISTNIVKQGTVTPAFAPYSIVEVTGTSGKPVRIGVLGVTRYSPVWQKAGPAGENLAVAQPLDMINTYLPEVRKKSDVVVLLASISKKDAQDIAKAAPDLDLIVAAYGGIYSTVEESEGHVRIVYTGNQGKRIGESRVMLDAKRRVADIVSYMLFLTARYPDDKATADAVAQVKVEIAKAAANPAPAEPAPPTGAH